METFAPSPTHLVSIGDYCVWRSDAHPFTVCFRRDAMARLDNQVIEGYGALPKRGAEVGGILLGRTDKEALSIVIEDVVPVPCEHITGPSYVLSDADQRTWATTLEHYGAGAGPRVVGCYRSDTRIGAEHLVLQQQDLAFMHTFFGPDEQAVLLMIRPRSIHERWATLFFFQHGELVGPAASPEKFPFGGPVSMPREPVPVTVPAALAPAPADSHEGVTVLPKSAAKKKARGYLLPLSALAAGLLCAVVLHQYQTESEIPEEVTGGNAGESLGLKAERVGNDLHISWNRSAPAVRAATGGTLSLTDGVTRKSADLDSAQVQSGSLVYTPKSSDVNLELQVQPGGGPPVQESVRAIVPVSGTPAASTEPDNPQPPAPAAPIGSARRRSIKKRSPVVSRTTFADSRVLRDRASDVKIGVDSSGRIVDKPADTQGGVRHFFNRVGSKAAHLWPFRSDKHQQNP